MSGARGDYRRGDYSLALQAAKVLSDDTVATGGGGGGGGSEESSPSSSSSSSLSGDPRTKSRGKHPRESEVGIPYLFSKDQFLLETYRNPWGEMRFGKILEDLDALAGNIAFNHVVHEGSDLLPLIVTAGVDRIRMRRRPNIDADQYLSGKVTWVGSSSMEIRMRITDGGGGGADGGGGGGSEWLEAYFTFVTLHPDTKKAIGIPPLIPETDEERAHFELGAVKAQARKEARRNKAELGRPLSEQSLKIDARAKRLLEEAGPLLQMPSLAEPNTMLISQTLQSNAMVAQPQARNLHDRIFGGFLMRRAFELAFATAYLFGGDKPRFLEVDDISFDKASFSFLAGGWQCRFVAFLFRSLLTLFHFNCHVLTASGRGRSARVQESDSVHESGWAGSGIVRRRPQGHAVGRSRGGLLGDMPGNEEGRGEQSLLLHVRVAGEGVLP